MATVRPIHATVLVVLFAAAVLVADYAYEGGFSRASYQKVSPDERGEVVIDVAGITTGQVRFFRFINTGNQEVKFFVGRAPDGEVHVAIDANALCYKLKRGYRHEGDWVVCNKCDKAFELAEVNDGGGGCKPIPLAHQLSGDKLVLQESEILTGWRYFR